MKSKKVIIIVLAVISFCSISESVMGSWNDVNNIARQDAYLPSDCAIPNSLQDTSISVQSPSNSSIWFTGEEYNISWTNEGNIDKVKIQLYENGTLLDDLHVFEYEENTGLFQWNISSFEEYRGSQYKIKISDYDNPEIYDYSDYFKINHNGDMPTIKLILPDANSYFKVGLNTIHVQTSGYIKTVGIYLYKDGVFIEEILNYTVEYFNNYNNGSIYGWEGTWMITQQDSYEGDDYQLLAKDWDDDDVFALSPKFKIRSKYIPGLPLFMIGLFSLCGISITINRFYKLKSLK